MKVISFFGWLLFCILLSIIIESLIISCIDKETTFKSNLIIFIFSWTTQSLMGHFIIYSIYFYIVYLLFKIIKSKIKYFVLVLLMIIYFLSVMTIDWSLSKVLFKTFHEYILFGHYYLVYTAVVILSISIKRI